MGMHFVETKKPNIDVNYLNTEHDASFVITSEPSWVLHHQQSMFKVSVRFITDKKEVDIYMSIGDEKRLIDLKDVKSGIAKIIKQYSVWQVENDGYAFTY